MFNDQAIQDLRNELAELKDALILSEERRNGQYTDIMLALRELKCCASTEDDEDDDNGEGDDLYEEVRAFVIKEQKASISLLQRRFKLGYGRAAHIMDLLEQNGVIEASDGTNRQRKVLEKCEVTDEHERILLKLAEHSKEPARVVEVKHTRKLARYCLEFENPVAANKFIALKTKLELAVALSPISIDRMSGNACRIYVTLPCVKSKKPWVYTFAEVISDEAYLTAQGSLVIPIGVGFDGLVTADLSQVGSILLAGSTGSGKSTFFHSTLVSLMQRYSPEQFRTLCIDPKRVELTLYDGAPHLYVDHAITSTSEALDALQDIQQEISRRASAPAHSGDARVLIAVDELSDLMASYPTEMEAVLAQIAQTGPSVGVHLMAGTSRPSPQVITGLLKSVIPTRIGFRVASLVDSRIIIDQSGAQDLLGCGDGLYLDKEMAKPIRIQAPYIRTQEVKDVLGRN